MNPKLLLTISILILAVNNYGWLKDRLLKKNI